MTERTKLSTLSSKLSYDDVRAVSPALEHYSKGPLLDSMEAPGNVITRQHHCDRGRPHRAHPDDRDAVLFCTRTR